jgi:TM2 domain-containing membrane protein YozV
VAGKGTTANVIAAICSFFIPGLGQLIQGRLLKAGLHVVIAACLWLISFGTLGWVMHIWSAYSAATYDPYA